MNTPKITATGTMPQIIAHRQRIDTFVEFIGEIEKRCGRFLGSICPNYSITSDRYHALLNLKISRDNICDVRLAIIDVASDPQRAPREPHDMYCHEVDTTNYKGVLIFIRYWSPE